MAFSALRLISYIVFILITSACGGGGDKPNNTTPVPTSNTAPVLTSSSTVTVIENTSFVITVNTFDADGDSLNYSFSGGVDESYFSIDAITGVLVFSSAPDYEAPTDANSDNVYEVQVAVSDGVTSATQDILVTVNNSNDNAPVITNIATATVVENTTSVIIVTATDADGDSLSYSLDMGIDQWFFTIDEFSGALSFVSAPDYEAPTDANSDNVYEVQVVVSNEVFHTTQDISITVANTNEAPVIHSSTFSVVEDQTSVTQVFASDPDGDSLSYNLNGGVDLSSFTITSNGSLSFVSAPDYEAPTDANSDNVYEAQVAVSDGTITTTQDIFVTVTNVNEAPIITSSNTAFVIENTTAVMTVSAIDEDGDTLTYNLNGGADQSAFMIDAASGALSFISAPDADSPTNSPGYEGASDNVYEVWVRVSDGTANTEQDILVTVKKQPPTSVSISSSTSDKVELSWLFSDSTFTKATGIAIVRKAGADGIYAVVGSVPATQTTFVDKGLSPATTYYYKLYAYVSYDPNQISTYTDEVNVTTQSFTTVPTAPGGLIASAINGWTIDLSWADSSGNEDGFVIERSTDGVSYTAITTVNNDTTTFMDDFVIDSTTYYYRVKAYNNQGDSTYATPYSLTTPVITPTDLSGGIAADITLALSNSPYLVSSNVTLAPGYIMTIEPGVHIRFATSTQMEIRGHLEAVGSSGDPIVFVASDPTSGSQTHWNGIPVANDLGGSATIQHAQVSNAQTALYRASSGALAVDVYDTIFDTNDNGIDVRGSSIYRLTFVNNNVGLVSTTNTNISYSIFKNNTYGLISHGFGVSVLYSTLTGHDVAIINRRGEVKYCTITNNNIGIQPYGLYYDSNVLNYNTVANNNDTGIILGDSNVSSEYNNIFDNTNYNIVNAVSFGSNATNNWWGSVSTTEIESKIYDFYDDPTLGIIDYLPPLNNPIDIIP